MHGYNGDRKLENLLYQFGVFLVLCRVNSSEPLKVVRYSRSWSEMQSIQNDPEGNLLYPMATSSGITHIVETITWLFVYQKQRETPRHVRSYKSKLQFRYHVHNCRKYSFIPCGLALNRYSCTFAADSMNNFVDDISKDGIHLYIDQLQWLWLPRV